MAMQLEVAQASAAQAAAQGVAAPTMRPMTANRRALDALVSYVAAAAQAMGVAHVFEWTSRVCRSIKSVSVCGHPPLSLWNMRV
jgi:hypothetical protein